MVPVDTLRTLLRSIEGSDIAEIDLVWKGVHLHVLQDPAAVIRVSETQSGRVAIDTGLAVNAPLTGVYYARPAPDKEAFVSIGSTVVAGQIVALIETMKLFNEVPSEVEGEVVEIMVAEGDLVETGQPLLRLRVARGGDE